MSDLQHNELSRVFTFTKDAKGEDTHRTWLHNDLMEIVLVLDGHGPSGVSGCTGMPETKAFVQELAHLIRSVVDDTITVEVMASGLVACATALSPALRRAVVLFLAEKDAEFWSSDKTRHAWIGSTMSLVLSMGGEFIAITVGDSPVYELAGGNQINKNDPVHPTAAEVRAAFPEDTLSRFGSLIYPNISEGGAVQLSAFAYERTPMKEKMTPEEYKQFCWKVAELFPLRISAVHRGRFLVASDGIDVFLRSGEITITPERIAQILAGPSRALTERLRGRMLPDDLTMVWIPDPDAPMEADAPAVPVEEPAESDPAVPVAEPAETDWGCFPLIPPS